VSCADVREQLGAYLDGEVPAAVAAAIAAHVEGCAACAALADRERALAAEVRAALPAWRAPDVLRARVREALRDAAPRAGAWRPTPWQGLVAAAAAVVLVVGTWIVATDRAAGAALTDDVLAAHVRSLMPGHLADVASTDQHTVKPWFDGRLDFSPPVTDEAAAGFPLLGGRLDYLGGRAVAALVYGRRLHRINVFVWPARSGSGGGGPAHAGRDGYFLEHWTAGGMTFWAVSDLNRAELVSFVRLLQQGGTGAPAAP